MTSLRVVRDAPGFLAAVAFGAGVLTGITTRTSSWLGDAGETALRGGAGPVWVLSLCLTLILAALMVLRKPTALPVYALSVLVLQGLFIGLTCTDASSDLPGLHLRRAVVLGTVSAPPQRRRDRIRFALKPDGVKTDSVWTSPRASLLVTVVWSPRDSLRVPVRYGDRVALQGVVLLPSPARNPGETDLRQWYRANGFSHEVLVRGGSSVRVLGAGDVPLLQRHVVDPVRAAALASLDRGYEGQAREFLKGLLLGIREGIDRETQEAFVNAGVAHILAVSGSNVALVAAIVLFLLALIRCPRMYAPIPVVLSLLLYMLITGSQPPVVRATVMALLVLGGRIVQRRVSGVNVIGVAALVLLIDSPAILLDAGFQLSFAAVLALVLVYPPLDRRILALRAHRLIRMPAVGLLRLAGISFVATLGTLPLTALSFGRVSLIGILANIPVVPLSGVSVVLGAVSILCSWVVPPLAAGFETINGMVLDLTLWIAIAAGGLPWASFDTSTWTTLDVVPIIACTGAVLCPPGSRPRRMLLIAAVGAQALAVLFVGPSVFEAPSRTLTVSVIDVGQGDAILLQFPDGVAALIDTGPRTPTFDTGERVIAPLLKRYGIEHLSHVIITHEHADHVGGLRGLVRAIPVDTLLRSSWMEPEGTTLPSRPIMGGAILRLTPDSRAYVLWPDHGVEGMRHGGANNRSLVLRVVFGGFSVLLTGDAEAAVERRLVERYGAFIRSTVLKVGHHGSFTSSSSDFLDTVKPDLAVMSVGALNRFGHPSGEVLERFAAMRCPVNRTDTDGCVVIRSDGRTWSRVIWRR